MTDSKDPFDVVIGAGFTGLSAARVLSKSGCKVCILEKDDPGGFAGTFSFNDHVKVEKFYHHWFNSDRYVMKLIDELDLSENILTRPSNTGIYLQ